MDQGNADRTVLGFHPTLAIYFVLLYLLLFIVELPLSYSIGFAREHAYGLSTQGIPYTTNL